MPPELSQAHPIPQARAGRWREERQQLRGLAFLCMEGDLKPGWGYHDDTSDSKSQKAVLWQAAILCVRRGTQGEPAESCPPGRCEWCAIPAWVLLLLMATAMGWHSSCLNKCLSPAWDRRDKGAKQNIWKFLPKNDAFTIP